MSVKNVIEALVNAEKHYQAQQISTEQYFSAIVQINNRLETFISRRVALAEKLIGQVSLNEVSSHADKLANEIEAIIFDQIESAKFANKLQA